MRISADRAALLACSWAKKPKSTRLSAL